MDLEWVTKGKAFDLDYHLFDIVKLSPERYFDRGIVRQIPEFSAESERLFFASRPQGNREDEIHAASCGSNPCQVYRIAESKAENRWVRIEYPCQREGVLIEDMVKLAQIKIWMLNFYLLPENGRNTYPWALPFGFQLGEDHIRFGGIAHPQEGKPICAIGVRDDLYDRNLTDNSAGAQLLDFSFGKDKDHVFIKLPAHLEKSSRISDLDTRIVRHHELL